MNVEILHISAAPLDPPAQGRPRAIEDPSNRWLIHRAGAALLPFAIRAGVHPNAVSLTGLGFGLLAGIAYSHWANPWMATLGFALMIGWHICDGIDGQLARATGKTSAFGRLLDGICDYATFFAVLLPIIFSFDDWPPLLAFGLTSGAAHVLQSAFYEGERESWIRRSRGEFTARARSEAGGPLEAVYNHIEATLGNHTRPIDDALAANPDLLPRYLAATQAPMLRLSILGANDRTLAIWIACLSGMPWLYFVWELFGLSLIGAMFAWRLRSVEADLCTASA
jgi:CDP-diacylglycerol---serine O-phosphatidyltransferase